VIFAIKKLRSCMRDDIFDKRTHQEFVFISIAISKVYKDFVFVIYINFITLLY
jgi:hypothetical protein